MKKKTVYEQPLNEFMKQILRLEYLFADIMYRLKGPAEWDNRAVINNLIAICQFIARVELKNDLINNLQHNIQTLKHWHSKPDTDSDRLAKLLHKTEILLEKLSLIEEPLGSSLSHHHLLRMVRQRSIIIGGSCGSDLPSFHHWLQKNPKQRQTDLNDWLAPLEPLREAISLNLYFIRNNAQVSRQIAVDGFFQTNLDTNNSNQIIQVAMPLDHPCYPDIKAGKHRLTIRFFDQPFAQQPPIQSQQDINFELFCCMN